MDFIRELWKFLHRKKKLWLFPLVLAMALVGSLLLIAKGSVIAPFIYTLF
jgi:hypothetical protein